MMNETEYILSCVSEECAEIIKAVEKARKFGLDDHDYLAENKTTNLEWIIEEWNDLMGVYKKMVKMGILKVGDLDTRKADQKVSKIEWFMRYARRKGKLE